MRKHYSDELDVLLISLNPKYFARLGAQEIITLALEADDTPYIEHHLHIKPKKIWALWSAIGTIRKK